jgi:hypothetical protein
MVRSVFLLSRFLSARGSSNYELILLGVSARRNAGVTFHPDRLAGVASDGISVDEALRCVWTNKRSGSFTLRLKYCRHEPSGELA